LSWRHFSGETEALAQRWATMTLTPDAWHPGNQIAATQTQPVEVQSGHVVGVGKPVALLADDKSRAAHEKIASDLGYRLGLPILPVLLWDRSGTPGVEPAACVVAWAFRPVYPLAAGAPLLTDAERLAVQPALSALLAFDFWVADTDRKSDHVVITVPRGGRPAAIGSIDYSNSMSFTWDCPDHPSTGSFWYQHEWPRLGLLVDADALAQAIERIENFDHDQIVEVVSNVPNMFLPIARRDIIIQNLTSRQSRIGSMIKI
jgi:hypothetical protein